MPFLFDFASWDDWEDWLGDQGLTIAIVVASLAVANWIFRRVLHRFLTNMARDRAQLDRREDPEGIERRADTLAATVNWAFNIFVLVLGIGLVLAELGLNVAPFLAGVGVVGIAVGFGAQTLVRDLINGFFVVIEDQYSVGDVVSIAGIDGVVVDINPRRTMVRDLDGSLHTIPNGEITIATNKSKGFARINLDVSVAYEEDVDRVIAVINDVCREFADAEAERVIEPPKVLRVNALGESGIDIKVLGDVKPLTQWELMGELRRRIKRRFDEEGIEIPYPHRTMITKGPLLPVAADAAAED